MIAYEFRCATCDRRVLSMYRMGNAPETRECAYEGCAGEMTKQLSRGSFTTVPGAHDSTYGVRSN